MSEMETSRAVLLVFVGVSGVWFSSISGAEVELRVRPGDNAVLYSDCVWKSRLETVWIRNSSNQNQSHLMVLKEETHPKFSLLWNPFNQTSDLLVKNVTESDLGLYYCALQETTPRKDPTQAGSLEEGLHYGNIRIHLSLLDETFQTSTPPVSDCSICWKLLISVCSVCVLLSFASVYCIYRTKEENNRKKESKKRTTSTSRTNEKVGGDDDVCYAALDHPNRGQKHLKKKKKKKRNDTSDFSTYSEVKTDKI